MKSTTKQNNSEVSQVRMTQLEPQHWLRLLGDHNQVNGSAGFGRNGHSVEMQSLATHPEMLNYEPDFWLRHLGGTGSTNHSTTNGRVAKMAPQALGNQQFTPEIWLRLLGDFR